MTIKKTLFNILKSIGGILAFLLLYGAMVLLLPMIETKAEYVAPDSVPVEAYIYTNGVHTDLVVPIKTAEKDWSKEVPFENTLSRRTDFKYLAVGWGDKGFYLNTPTWADLKFSTAFNAAFWLSESAMHCTFYRQMKEGEDCKKILLTPEQYRNLCSYIEDKFEKDAGGKFILIKTNAVYGKNDAFYEAKGKYSFLNTCNTWANNGLKAAGQRAAFWTATDSGIFRHYK